MVVDIALCRSDQLGYIYECIRSMYSIYIHVCIPEYVHVYIV